MDIHSISANAIQNIQLQKEAVQEQNSAKRVETLRGTTQVPGNIAELKAQFPKIYDTLLRYFQMNIFNMVKKEQDRAMERQKRRNRGED